MKQLILFEDWFYQYIDTRIYINFHKIKYQTIKSFIFENQNYNDSCFTVTFKESKYKLEFENKENFLKNLSNKFVKNCDATRDTLKIK